MLRLLQVITGTVCLFLSLQIASGHEFKFPDEQGTIIHKGMGYAVKMLEPAGNLQIAEAMFYVKSSPTSCFKAASDFTIYPQIMPDTLQPKLIKKNEENNNYQFTIQAKNSANQDMLINWSIQYKKDSKEYSQIYYTEQVTAGNFMSDPTVPKLSFETIPKMIWELRLMSKEPPYK